MKIVEALSSPCPEISATPVTARKKRRPNPFPEKRRPNPFPEVNSKLHTLVICPILQLSP